jgi:hypothetical protein
MGLEDIEGLDSKVLESLKGARILAGATYDLKSEKHVKGSFYKGATCEPCDCVCNQPCHGEGACYSL